MRDQLNRKLQLKTIPKRIISLVPSQTELLVDLGLEDSIIGITKFCVHPTYLKKQKTIVGGTKTINIEKIKALQPDIILCNKEENTKEIVNLCQEIAPTHVSDIYTIQDTLTLIQQYGTLFSCTEKASKMIEDIQFKLNDFQQHTQDKKKLTAAYFIWRNPWMAAGNNNFINYLLDLNNFENMYGHKPRYPEVELKKIASEGNPDLIFLSSEPYPFKEEHKTEIQQFAKKAKIIFVDGEMFSWYGSRLLKAFDYFKELQNRIREISF